MVLLIPEYLDKTENKQQQKNMINITLMFRQTKMIMKGETFHTKTAIIRY